MQWVIRADKIINRILLQSCLRFKKKTKNVDCRVHHCSLLSFLHVVLCLSLCIVIFCGFLNMLSCVFIVMYSQEIFEYVIGFISAQHHEKYLCMSLEQSPLYIRSRILRNMWFYDLKFDLAFL